ncbi:DUF2913 family protein, partial [Enterobacter asburiae]|uniref:DUF2913 family protein n=1 Tax=Enterobacter asburiae TaxID=61645 RepID=UPI0021CF39FC
MRWWDYGWLSRTARHVHRWLADVQKQHRFPRSVAPDIDSLLRLGRMKGPAADLQQRLQYLWQSCTEPVT